MKLIFILLILIASTGCYEIWYVSGSLAPCELTSDDPCVDELLPFVEADEG